MAQTYQSHNKAARSTDDIYTRGQYEKRRLQMKAAGTYCDSSDPDLSFLNFRPSCRSCPNYKECKEESEERSKDILKYRRGKIQKSKTNRKGGKKK